MGDISRIGRGFCSYQNCQIQVVKNHKWFSRQKACHGTISVLNLTRIKIYLFKHLFLTFVCIVFVLINIILQSQSQVYSSPVIANIFYRRQLIAYMYMISNKILVCELEQYHSYVPLPLRGPANSTCVKAGGGGLREAPHCNLHSVFFGLFAAVCIFAKR